LEKQLLSPFEYYGCDDDTDFANVPWDQPGEREAISKIVTGNEVRARLVIDEWRRLSGNAAECKALVFCVSVAHAQFMTAKFNEARLPALCVVGETEDDIRRQAPTKLQMGEVCALVTCDLYNEGVDLPGVDTLLLLRPTQSPVLFQQQIGRGLRLSEGKESCLILDFVGRYRTEFRFDRLLSTITGLSRNEMVGAVEKGFSSLPPGCHIQLQKFTRDQILASLRAAINHTWRRLKTELQSYVALRGRSNVRLSYFLREQNLELQELYRNSEPSGWTALQREIGLIPGSPSTEEGYFGKRFSSLLHYDDPEQIELLLKLEEKSLSYERLTEREQRRLQMLVYQIDGQHHQKASAKAFLERIANTPEIKKEAGALGGMFQGKETILFKSIPELEDIPLCLHASYGVREILTAVGWLTAESRTPFQAGVLALKERRTELLFVTLDKSKGYHDKIAYHDYAISSTRFHWQTQNSAGPETTAGRRYLESPANGWTFQLFVRTTSDKPYRACGPVVFQEAHGAKPMSIVWALKVPLPVRLFDEFSVLRGQ
jgi:hypothetical protein